MVSYKRKSLKLRRGLKVITLTCNREKFLLKLRRGLKVFYLGRGREKKIIHLKLRRGLKVIYKALSQRE